MELLATTANQVMQLIFCLLAVVIFARLVNFLLTRRPIEVENSENENEIIPKEDEKIEVKEEIKSGWESEIINDNVESQKPQLEVPCKVVKQQLKIPRRKCISVGPVMLTPNSQIIRKLNVEEREERYRYDILPINSPSKAIVAILGDDEKKNEE
jgi:hypothetical protein